MSRFLLLPLLAVLALTGCENSATSFTQESPKHAIMLVREQSAFWSSKIDQFIIASNLPRCQRRVRIHPGVKPMMEMRIYWAGDHLWALHQGRRWYLVSTAPQCRVQDWNNSESKPPGALLGRFVWDEKAAAPAFQAAPEAETARAVP